MEVNEMIIASQRCNEKQLFCLIDSLGYVVWRFEHDLADGRLESNPELEKWLMEQKTTMISIVNQTSRFGVAIELDKPVHKDYWDWYRKHKKWWGELSDEECRQFQDEMWKNIKCTEEMEEHAL